MKRDLLDRLLAARAARQSIAVVTDIETGAQKLVARGEDAGLEQNFRFDHSGVFNGRFVHIHNPPLRLLITGAVHIAQSVIPFAQAMNYDVTVIDPRGAFATGQRFPGIALHVEWPDEVIARTGLDGHTAMIALTHDPKIDDPALAAALKSDVFYIGALGSKKTHASRCERLRAQGFSAAQIARIAGPIGLDIGAKGAAEIAVSIMAQMTRALRLGA